MAYVVCIGKTAYAVSGKESIRATRWCKMADDRSAGKKPHLPANKAVAVARQNKLAAALRDNLLKRKQQSRARSGAPGPESNFDRDK